MVVRDLQKAGAIDKPTQHRNSRILRLTGGTLAATAANLRRQMAASLGVALNLPVTVKFERNLWNEVSAAAAAAGIPPEQYASRILLQHLGAETGKAIAKTGHRQPVQLDLEDAIIAAKAR